MMQFTKHFPDSVVPDLDPKAVKTNQLIYALNVRIGVINPRGVAAQQGAGTYRRPGNTEIENTDLPSGQSWCVGACQDKPTGIIYFSLWNEDPDFHTIFKFVEPDVFTIVAQGSYLNFSQPIDPDGDDFIEDYYVHMEYLQSGLLTFEDNKNEDRVINPAVAIAGGVYPDPIPDWMLAQLHRPPAFAPLLYGVSGDSESTVDYISGTVPKPISDIQLQGYQFGYNYGYLGNIESRISEPSIVNWNNGPYLLIPEEEFLTYMGDGTTANPYIEYVKFYYRIGNTGNWNQFQKIANTTGNWLVNPATTPAVAAGNYFGLILPDMESLTPIGGTSAAALNLIDGVPIRSKGSVPAENKLVKWYPTFGYDFTPPSIPDVMVVSDNRDVNDMVDQSYRIFPPIDYRVDLAEVFRDIGGRVIGTRSLGTFTVPKPNDYTVDQDDQVGITNFDTATWQQVVDYPNLNPGPDPGLYNYNSTIDARGSGRIRIEPTAATLPDEVDTVHLIVRPRIAVTMFKRSLVRPFFVYGDENIGFRYFLDNVLESYVIDGITFSFYGFAFLFSSGDGINFSTEQNFYIQVRGQTLPKFNPAGFSKSTYIFDTDIQFKITGQEGLFLLSKQPFTGASPSGDAQWLSAFGFDSGDNGTVKGFFHSILDITLYSKTQTQPILWNQIPTVGWTRDQYLANDILYYYGDSYFTADEKHFSPYLNTANIYYQSDGGGTATQIDYSLGNIVWQGYFGSMNLNGIFLEEWDSDQGNAVAINSEPKQTTRTKGLIRGEEYLPDTQVNNQFVFDPINVSQVNGNIGSITRVGVLAPGTSTGDNLYCICQSGSEIIFLGKTQIQSTTGEGDIAVSTSLFGSHNTQPLSYGAFSQREVVFTGEGMAFYFDRINNVFVQLSLAGQDPVSMQQFFVSDMADMGNANEPLKHGAIGWDPLYTEAVYVEANEGFAYNAGQKKYQGLLSIGETLFTEMFQFSSQRVFSKQLFGFAGGRLFKFNDGNQFNGEDFTAKMKLVSVPGNQNHDFVKAQYLAGNSGGQHQWNMFLATSNGKESSLDGTDFRDRKQYFEASIKRNEDEGGKYTGAIMDGMWMKVLLEDFDNNAKSLTFVGIGVMSSLTDGNHGG